MCSGKTNLKKTPTTKNVFLRDYQNLDFKISIGLRNNKSIKVGLNRALGLDRKINLLKSEIF